MRFVTRRQAFHDLKIVKVPRFVNNIGTLVEYE